MKESSCCPTIPMNHTRDRPQVFEPPRVLVWELVMGCIWVAVDAGPTEGGRRPTGVGAAVSWAA
jgi:hypothetical protein